MALLLPRFTDRRPAACGSAEIDLRELRLRDLRAETGVVFEEAFLFSDTIRNNIATAGRTRPTPRSGRHANRRSPGSSRTSPTATTPGRRVRPDPVELVAAADPRWPGRSSPGPGAGADDATSAVDTATGGGDPWDAAGPRPPSGRRCWSSAPPVDAGWPTGSRAGPRPGGRISTGGRGCGAGARCSRSCWRPALQTSWAARTGPRPGSIRRQTISHAATPGGSTARPAATAAGMTAAGAPCARMPCRHPRTRRDPRPQGIGGITPELWPDVRRTDDPDRALGPGRPATPRVWAGTVSLHPELPGEVALALPPATRVTTAA
ncbi:hypothetical protein HBB16_13120 [Pseudonocardia sp. MCCB 268]|nr:hypothetical protein [Pseudonocardia cytotoxica]